MMKSTRHFVFGTTAFAAILCASTLVLAQPKEVKVAVAVPLSGAWARSGELFVKGAELAVDHINAAGGIKALGGAKMRLVVADTGDSTEKAKNAAQRLVSQEPDLVGGTGAFVSSFTLAVTEVTERAELPWLTLSYSEVITGRGYKYVFQTSMTAGAQAENALPVLSQVMKSATGATPKTIGIVMDNTASPVAFTKPMREGGFDKLGLKLVVDEIYTPPLSDATSLVQKVRNAKPDILLMLTNKVPDTKLVAEKLNEMGLGIGRGDSQPRRVRQCSEVFPRRTVEVRAERAPRRGGARDRAVAERRAQGDLSAFARRGEGDVAEALGSTKDTKCNSLQG